LRRLQGANTRLIEQFKDAEARREYLGDLVTNLQENDSKSVIQKLHTEKEALLEQIKTSDEKIANLNKLKFVIEEEKINIQEAQKEVNRVLREQVQQQQEEIKNLQQQYDAEIAEKTQISETLQAEKLSHEKNIEEIRSQHSEEILAIKEEINVEIRKREKISEELKVEKETSTELEEKLNSERKNIEKLKDEVVTVQTAKTYLAEDLLAEKTLREQVANDFKSEQIAKIKLGRELDKIRSENKELQKKIEGSRKQHRRIKTRTFW